MLAARASPPRGMLAARATSPSGRPLDAGCFVAARQNPPRWKPALETRGSPARAASRGPDGSRRRLVSTSAGTLSSAVPARSAPIRRHQRPAGCQLAIQQTASLRYLTRRGRLFRSHHRPDIELARPIRIQHQPHHATERHRDPDAAQPVGRRHGGVLPEAGFRRQDLGRTLSVRHPDRGTLEIHFFTHDTLLPEESSAGCYLRVADVHGLHQAFAAAQLPGKGIPRMDAPEDKPWGMREFAVVDPDGNLLRIGQKLGH